MEPKKKRHIIDGFMILSLIIGIGVLTYPFVSDTLNDYLDQQIIAHYQTKASQGNTKETTELQEKMEKKNQKLAKKGSNPRLNPLSETQKATGKPDKSYFENHTISVLTTPEISVHLPIFNRTNALLLERESSLSEGTSYPTDGVNTHAVTSGHHGFPQAKLSTDLPELKKDDEFYVEVSGKTLAYQVDQIRVVEPADTEDLCIESDQDLVALSTCTPCMTNSHRLLVRGHRVPCQPEKAAIGMKKVARQQDLLLWTLLLITCALTISDFIIWYK